MHKEFIQPDKYIEVRSATFFIAAHNRQQAIGNTLGSIYGGNKTFMRKTLSFKEKEGKSSWTLQEYGLENYDYELLKSVSALSELPEVKQQGQSSAYYRE